MMFKAQLSAALVAQYIYTHGGMWQYQQLRLDRADSVTRDWRTTHPPKNL